MNYVIIPWKLTQLTYSYHIKFSAYPTNYLFIHIRFIYHIPIHLLHKINIHQKNYISMQDSYTICSHPSTIYNTRFSYHIIMHLPHIGMCAIQQGSLQSAVDLPCRVPFQTTQTHFSHKNLPSQH